MVGKDLATVGELSRVTPTLTLPVQALLGGITIIDDL
jgi:hypothetical protein